MDNGEEAPGVASMWERGLAPLKVRPGDVVKEEAGMRRVRPRAKAKKVPRVPPRENPWDLTPRQTDVMDMVVEGMTSEEIGERLSISVATVKIHKERAREKMDAKNSLRAAVLWDRFVRMGIHQERARMREEGKE